MSKSKLPKPLKYGLITLAVLVLLGLVVVGGLVAWVKSNEPHWQTLKQESLLAGQRFAEGKSADECTLEAQRRIVLCEPKNPLSQSECETAAYLFQDACLKQNTPSDEECARFDFKEKGLFAALNDSKRVCKNSEAKDACVKSKQRLRAFCRGP